MTELPLVSVLCPTYNHAAYIRKCLDSVIAQDTGFPYEILVNDDCSTDGTTDIVKAYARKYPSLIRAFTHSSNQFSQGTDIVRDILLPEARGKYIAICEGDDYWTHRQKLQLQAEMMEKHPHVGLVYTYFDKVVEATGKKRAFHFHELEGYVYPEALAGKDSIWYVTVMMRKDLMLQAPQLDTHKYFTGDIFWFSWISSRSEVMLLREHTAVHRILGESMSHFKDPKKKIDFFYLSSNTRLYFATHHPPLRKKRYARLAVKKSSVNCMKYALAHGDYPICKDLHIPFFPLMSLKKTGFALLRRLCFSESVFRQISRRYNRHLTT